MAFPLTQRAATPPSGRRWTASLSDILKEIKTSGAKQRRGPASHCCQSLATAQCVQNNRQVMPNSSDPSVAKPQTRPLGQRATSRPTLNSKTGRVGSTQGSLLGEAGPASEIGQDLANADRPGHSQSQNKRARKEPWGNIHCTPHSPQQTGEDSVMRCKQPTVREYRNTATVTSTSIGILSDTN